MTALTTLTAERLTKAFGSNVAVSSIDLSVTSGSIVTLVGSNGSGKSTLLKIIYGSLVPDSGCAYLNGTPMEKGNPHATRSLGVEMVFQDKDDEARLGPGITVLENLFLGREPTSRFGFIRLRQMEQEAGLIADKYKLSFPPLNALFGHLSGGQQKMVAIGRALLSNPRVLLLDEPTSSLGLNERDMIHQAILSLRASGVGILLCSHSLEEVTQVGDRIMALRSGQLIADQDIRALAEHEIAVLMSK